MYRTRKYLLLIAGLLSCSAFSTFAAEKSQYVQGREAKVMSEPNFKAQTLVTIPKGGEVAVLRAEGNWVEVTSGEHKGWVSKFLLSDRPPVGKISIKASASESEGDEKEGNVRRRASAVTTAGAARGLADADRLRSSDSILVNQRSVTQVEENRVAEDEVTRFIEERSE